ncbi:MAG: hypothetical protein WAW39_29195 [Prosthecobacter sp.]|uniref:hypothetical protein n=1 Tax=Prosthecobacter sp. TaxID=1965333 RepID=UPI003BAEFE1C
MIEHAKTTLPPRASLLLPPPCLRFIRQCRDDTFPANDGMDVLTKGGTVNEALKAVNEIVDRDNRSKLDEEDMQMPFTSVFKDGLHGHCILGDLRRHNARINDERKAGMKKAGAPVP